MSSVIKIVGIRYSYASVVEDPWNVELKHALNIVDGHLSYKELLYSYLPKISDSLRSSAILAVDETMKSPFRPW